MFGCDLNRFLFKCGYEIVLAYSVQSIYTLCKYKLASHLWKVVPYKFLCWDFVSWYATESKCKPSSDV